MVRVYASKAARRSETTIVEMSGTGRFPLSPGTHNNVSEEFFSDLRNNSGFHGQLALSNIEILVNVPRTSWQDGIGVWISRDYNAGDSTCITRLADAAFGMLQRLRILRVCLSVQAHFFCSGSYKEPLDTHAYRDPR